MFMRFAAFFLAVLPVTPALTALQVSPPMAAPAQATPAEQSITAARLQIAADPKHAEAYTDLALALIRRTRETADPQWLAQADDAIASGLRVAPGDLQLLKAHVALLLARQQWQESLAAAQALNKKNPDDVTVYGYIAEADIAMGNYEDADTSAQWMLNMRPNNVPGLVLGARLRVHYGDPSGALEFLGQAFAETPQVEVEELAWIACRMAEIEITSGQLASAKKTLARAEELFPPSPVVRDLKSRLALADHTREGTVAMTAQQPATPVAALPPPATTAPLTLKHDTGGVPRALLIARPTSTDRTIKKMQARVTASPQDPAGYSGLGAAFFQRARETGDVEDYSLAEQALQRSLSLLSTDLSAALPLETMAEVCMGEHRFADALDYAQRALALGSGDLSPFAVVGDAYADMGDYEKARIAYTRLQPAIATSAPQPTYAQRTRTAYLAFVAGDTDAAIAGMQAAVSEGLEARLPAENLAWLYYELGEFSFQNGKVQNAADAYLTALTVYPGDYRALAGLGKVRASQGKFDDAITLYQAAIAVVPMPIYIAELGDIYAKTGDSADAEKQYKLVEYIGRLGHINQVLHNRDLALFYADHDRNLAESLSLAHKEFEVRSDIYTWDALAWALYKNGKYSEAEQAMQHASRLGTKDSLLLFHAGMILSKLGQTSEAARLLDEALLTNPNFSVRYAKQAAEQRGALGHQADPAQSAGLTSSKGGATQR